MAEGSAGITVTSTVPDLSNLGGMLFDSERKVLTRFRSRALLFVKTEWTGWRYEGRPTNAPRNVSMKAWKAKVIVNTTHPELVIENAARGYQSGEDYVAYVRRRKGDEVEWRRVGRKIEETMLGPMVDEMIREVTKTLNAPVARRPIRARAARPDTLLIASSLVL